MITHFYTCTFMAAFSLTEKTINHTLSVNCSRSQATISIARLRLAGRARVNAVNCITLCGRTSTVLQLMQSITRSVVHSSERAPRNFRTSAIVIRSKYLQDVLRTIRQTVIREVCVDNRKSARIYECVFIFKLTREVEGPLQLL